jgi:hypothetical protein
VSAKFAANHGRFPQRESVEQPANIRVTEPGIGQINKASQIRRSQSVDTAGRRVEPAERRHRRRRSTAHGDLSHSKRGSPERVRGSKDAAGTARMRRITRLRWRWRMGKPLEAVTCEQIPRLAAGYSPTQCCTSSN